MMLAPAWRPAAAGSLETHGGRALGRPLGGQRGQGLGQGVVLQRRGAQVQDGAAGLFQVGARQRQGLGDGLPAALGGVLGLQQGIGRFELEGDGGETLGQGVVDLARQAVALLRRAKVGLAREQAGALDRDGQEITDGVEQAQVARGQLAPARAGDVEDAELLGVGVERDAGVVAQPSGAAGIEPFEPAAGDDVDIGGAVEVAGAESVEAVARAFHAMRVTGQAGRQVEGGGQVGVAGVFAQQPDPAGAEVQQVGHASEDHLQGLRQVDFAVEGFGNRVENRKLAVAALEHFGVGVGAGRRGHG
jgi:hypothetical protein